MKKQSVIRLFSLLSTGLIIGMIASSCVGVKEITSKIEQENKNRPVTKPTPDPIPEPKPEVPNDNSGTQALLNKARTELDAKLNSKETNVSAYNDYSVIKTELEAAYNSSEMIKNNNEATVDQLEQAKNSLEQAITKAQNDKTDFDSSHMRLVSTYNGLKTVLESKESNLSSLNDPKYAGLKSVLENKYAVADGIITNTLQASDLTEQTINVAKSDIENATQNLNQKKENAESYYDFKKFSITDSTQNFIGTFAKSATNTGNNYSTAFNSDETVTDNWKIASKRIEHFNLQQSKAITDVAWIYNLSTDSNASASYDVNFEYYNGTTATLYFPYKKRKSSDDLGLLYKLNTGQNMDISSIISNATIDDIKVAKISLTNLKFGQNKISFSLPQNKQNPIIGNIYISSTNSEESENKVIDSIFGNERNDSNSNSVTVNFVKGYGLSNKPIMLVTKKNGKLDQENTSKDYYLVGWLGGKEGSGELVRTVRYYTFYVNVNQRGVYDITGIYNTTVQRTLMFWVDNFNNSSKKAKFKDLNSGWNLKTFNNSNKDNTIPTSLELEKGLNKIVVSGDETGSEGPNLGNVTFTLRQ
ncbi:hypothetical protein LNO75_00365 [Mycoplasma sp. T363T]|uniref:hypothetical protein n=1 Tax=Mycoplasma bradburyae TaxID=2963128 RepID=UPI00234287C4|nr:hypothetical protein [Mycoplasma bradburyae]MDC4163034.1 hypothetical protein [Mycoplasma bradburyae]